MTSAAIPVLSMKSLRALLPLVRLCAMLLQLAITAALLGVALVGPALLMNSFALRFGLVAAALSTPFAFALWGLCFCVLVAGAKRTIFPVTPVGSFPFYSATVVRWAFVTQLAKVAHQMFLIWVIGTDVMAWWYRLLGAKIGRRVTINTVFLYDWDMLAIGDDSFIGGRSSVMAHIGQMGRVTFSPTVIGSGCTIGQDTSVFAGVTMEDRSVIGANSLALRNQRFLANCTYLGVPSELVSRKPQRTKYVDSERTTGHASQLFLDRNENQFPLSPACLEVLSRITVQDITHYPRHDALGKALSEWIGVDRDRISIGAGGEGILKTAFQSILKSGDTIVAPEASWGYYEQLASAMGVTVRTFPVVERESTFSFARQDVVAAARAAGAKVVLLSSPNNPTGNSLSDEDVQWILSALPETCVIVDEAYWGYTHTSNAHVRTLVAAHPNVLIVRSFSKFFGMPGIRVGFGIAGRNLQKFSQMASVYLGNNRIAEELAIAALSTIDHYGAIAEQISDEKRRIGRALSGIPGIRTYSSEANFLLLRLGPSYATAFHSQLRRAGIHVKLIDVGKLSGCIRMTIGTPEQNDSILKVVFEAIEVAA